MSLLDGTLGFGTTGNCGWQNAFSVMYLIN